MLPVYLSIYLRTCIATDYIPADGGYMVALDRMGQGRFVTYVPSGATASGWLRVDEVPCDTTLCPGTLGTLYEHIVLSMSETGQIF